MKRNFWAILFVFFQFFVLFADENTKIYADQCLKLATDTKVSADTFNEALRKVKKSCVTQEEKKFFEEFEELADTLFKMRPLVTAVIGFSCDDPSLSMMLKPSAVAELLETSLDDSFEKVTRRDLDKAIAELNLQNSDLFDESSRTKLGNFVGAQYVISGNIQKVSGNIVITARCIEVSTGKILKDGSIELKDVGEVSDAIPALAEKLSMRHLRKDSVSLSHYFEKYLKSANKNLFHGDFDVAKQHIDHGKMFLSGSKGKDTVIPMQMLLAENTCSNAKGAYEDSVVNLNKSLEIAKYIFGDTDDVVIHCYYNLAQIHLEKGNLAKAKDAYRDAMQRLQRTKDNSRYIAQFTDLAQAISRAESKKKFSYDDESFARKNNTLIGQGLFSQNVVSPQTDSTSAPEEKK